LHLDGVGRYLKLRVIGQSAKNEAQTIAIAATLLFAAEHLGEAKDFTTYLIACLTRDKRDPATVTNFSLDADRVMAT
jgi:hypothetical protein